MVHASGATRFSGRTHDQLISEGSELLRLKNLSQIALCVRNAPQVHRGDRPDTSKADFTWCMIAIDWGHSVEEAACRPIVSKGLIDSVSVP